MCFKPTLQFVCQKGRILEQLSKFLLLIKRMEPQSSLSFCTCLGHIMFPKNLKGIGIVLLIFREHIAKGHTFVPALLADTFRALEIARTSRPTYLEYCISLLQVWFFEHLIACQPLIIKGLFQEDLILAHLKKTSSSSFKSKAQ